MNSLNLFKLIRYSFGGALLGFFVPLTFYTLKTFINNKRITLQDQINQSIVFTFGVAVGFGVGFGIGIYDIIQ